MKAPQFRECDRLFAYLIISNAALIIMVVALVLYIKWS
jgi:hypothetical protein